MTLSGVRRFGLMGSNPRGVLPTFSTGPDAEQGPPRGAPRVLSGCVL